jgi:hypothetical protein
MTAVQQKRWEQVKKPFNTRAVDGDGSRERGKWFARPRPLGTVGVANLKNRGLKEQYE